MTSNINEAVEKIKKVGRVNTRIVQTGNGKTPQEDRSKIEIREDGNWVTIVSGITIKMAEEIISQASNKVILG